MLTPVGIPPGAAHRRITLAEIARFVDGEIVGDGGVEIARVAKIEDAGPGDITFLANLKYRKHVRTTTASALLIATDASLGEFSDRAAPLNLVRVPDPYRAFLRLIDLLHPASSGLKRGIHPLAWAAPSAQMAPDVAIGAFAVIGEGCVLGPGVSIHAGTVIGDGVVIEEASLLYPNVVVYEGCHIGKRVIVHAGCVIGSDGFGFAPTPAGRYEKIPQRGIVVIEDDAEIGANCTIDRATIGETRVGRGVKLDNLVQIGHNAAVGDDSVICAQSGISGSTRIGKNCSLGGQVGLAGHIDIADRTTIGAQSGIRRSICETGKTYFGYPGREIHETLRLEVVLNRLPALVTELRDLQARVRELEAALQAGASNDGTSRSPS